MKSWEGFIASTAFGLLISTTVLASDVALEEGCDLIPNNVIKELQTQMLAEAGVPSLSTPKEEDVQTAFITIPKADEIGDTKITVEMHSGLGEGVEDANIFQTNVDFSFEKPDEGESYEVTLVKVADAMFPDFDLFGDSKFADVKKVAVTIDGDIYAVVLGDMLAGRDFVGAGFVGDRTGVDTTALPEGSLFLDEDAIYAPQTLDVYMPLVQAAPAWISEGYSTAASVGIGTFGELSSGSSISLKSSDPNLPGEMDELVIVTFVTPVSQEFAAAAGMEYHPNMNLSATIDSSIGVPLKLADKTVSPGTTTAISHEISPDNIAIEASTMPTVAVPHDMSLEKPAWVEKHEWSGAIYSGNLMIDGEEQTVYFITDPTVATEVIGEIGADNALFVALAQMPRTTNVGGEAAFWRTPIVPNYPVELKGASMQYAQIFEMPAGDLNISKAFYEAEKITSRVMALTHDVSKVEVYLSTGGGGSRGYGNPTAETDPDGLILVTSADGTMFAEFVSDTTIKLPGTGEIIAVNVTDMVIDPALAAIVCDARSEAIEEIVEATSPDITPETSAENQMAFSGAVFFRDPPYDLYQRMKGEFAPMVADGSMVVLDMRYGYLDSNDPVGSTNRPSITAIPMTDSAAEALGDYIEGERSEEPDYIKNHVFTVAAMPGVIFNPIPHYHQVDMMTKEYAANVPFTFDHTTFDEKGGMNGRPVIAEIVGVRDDFSTYAATDPLSKMALPDGSMAVVPQALVLIPVLDSALDNPHKDLTPGWIGSAEIKTDGDGISFQIPVNTDIGMHSGYKGMHFDKGSGILTVPAIETKDAIRLKTGNDIRADAEVSTRVASVRSVETFVSSVEMHVA